MIKGIAYLLSFANDVSDIDKKTTQNPSKNPAEPTRKTSTKSTEKSIGATGRTSSKPTEKSIGATRRTSSKPRKPKNQEYRMTTTDLTYIKSLLKPTSESSILSFDLFMVFILAFIVAF